MKSWYFSVPHLSELKNGCVSEIAKYRTCLDRHAAQDDQVIEKKCGGLMREVWQCSERVMSEIQQRDDHGVEAGGRLV